MARTPTKLSGKGKDKGPVLVNPNQLIPSQRGLITAKVFNNLPISARYILMGLPPEGPTLKTSPTKPAPAPRPWPRKPAPAPKPAPKKPQEVWGELSAGKGPHARRPRLVGTLNKPAPRRGMPKK